MSSVGLEELKQGTALMYEAALSFMPVYSKCINAYSMPKNIEKWLYKI